jgi:hypothetical protein
MQDTMRPWWQTADVPLIGVNRPDPGAQLEKKVPVAEMSPYLADTLNPDIPAYLAMMVAHEEQFLRRATTLIKPGARPFLGWGSNHAFNTALIWSVHTHARMKCRDSKHISKGMHEADDPGVLAFPTTPRLGIFAKKSEYSEMGEGSGKSALMEALLSLCAVPRIELEDTGPALARVIGEEHATIGIDEGASYFNGRSHKMSRSILESGYRMPQTGVPAPSTSRMWGNTLYRIKTFGPAVLATLAVPSVMGNEELRPLLSRFIKIFITAAPPGYRLPRITLAEWQRNAKIVSATQMFMMNAVEMFTSATLTFDLPDYMSARLAEQWEPLLITAGYIDHTAKEADEAAKRPHTPVWVPRMLAAMDWFCNGGAQKDRIASARTDVQEAAWMQ